MYQVPEQTADTGSLPASSAKEKEVPLVCYSYQTTLRVVKDQFLLVSILPKNKYDFMPPASSDQKGPDTIDSTEKAERVLVLDQMLCFWTLSFHEQ